MSTEFQEYRLVDFLKATAVAPLACIPAVLLVDLLIIFPSWHDPTSPRESWVAFTGWAQILTMISLPSAYITTAIFGTLGFVIGNLGRIRLTNRIGAFAGVVCGIFTGLIWVAFVERDSLASGILDLRFLFEGLGLIILSIAILSGFFVGASYSQLLNRFVQNRSTR